MIHDHDEPRTTSPDRRASPESPDSPDSPQSAGSPADSPTGAASSAASPTRPTIPLPPEPEDVDALLADSLRAQSEQEFTWKEPERRPRWYERAEMQQAASAESPSTPAAAAAPGKSPGRRRGRPRIGQAVFALICLMLALWVLAAVVLNVMIDPLMVALGICAVAGLALVVGGLRPRPGVRL